jgi:hypothetical protein
VLWSLWGNSDREGAQSRPGDIPNYQKTFRALRGCDLARSRVCGRKKRHVDGIKPADIPRRQVEP